MDEINWKRYAVRWAQNLIHAVETLEMAINAIPDKPEFTEIKLRSNTQEMKDLAQKFIDMAKSVK